MKKWLSDMQTQATRQALGEGAKEIGDDIKQDEGIESKIELNFAVSPQFHPYIFVFLINELLVSMPLEQLKNLLRQERQERQAMEIQ